MERNYETNEVILSYDELTRCMTPATRYNVGHISGVFSIGNELPAIAYEDPMYASYIPLIAEEHLAIEAEAQTKEGCPAAVRKTEDGKLALDMGATVLLLGLIEDEMYELDAALHSRGHWEYSPCKPESIPKIRAMIHDLRFLHVELGETMPANTPRSLWAWYEQIGEEKRVMNDKTS